MFYNNLMWAIKEVNVRNHDQHFREAIEELDDLLSMNMLDHVAYNCALKVVMLTDGHFFEFCVTKWGRIIFNKSPNDIEIRIDPTDLWIEFIIPKNHKHGHETGESGRKYPHFFRQERQWIEYFEAIMI